MQLGANIPMWDIGGDPNVVKFIGDIKGSTGRRVGTKSSNYC